MLKKIAMAFPPIRRIQENRWSLRENVARLEELAAKQQDEILDQKVALANLSEIVEQQRQAIARPILRKDNLYIPSSVFSGTDIGEYMPSSIPLASDFLHPKFTALMSEIGYHFEFHRKFWEFAYIAHHLERMGAIELGKRGLCFGAGEEPLPALFAKRGCTITATDAPAELTAGTWIETSQHANDLSKLSRPAILDNETFIKRVTFEECDMNNIPSHLNGYDFCWSACCLEHLGSLQHGLDFILNSIEKTLKIGGVACHTTELNLTSDDETLELEHLSLYRRQDLRRLTVELESRGHEVSPLVIFPGASPVDYYVDTPPFLHHPHLKLQLDKYVTTSVGIVVRRGR